MTKSVKNVHIHMNGTVHGMKFLKTPSHPIPSRGMGQSHGLSHSYPIPLRNPDGNPLANTPYERIHIAHTRHFDYSLIKE